MSEVPTERAAKPGRTFGGWVWFSLHGRRRGSFFALLLFSESTLRELWQRLRDLPLLAEGLVWLLLFPLVLATAVWESSWDGGLRLGLVCLFALVWSTLFLPRRRRAS